MRFVLDANLVTYIAFFEGYMIGECDFDEERAYWEAMNEGRPIDVSMKVEINALRVLYQVDDRAHFDWLISDIALREIKRIRLTSKRHVHLDLVQRLVEHRADVIDDLVQKPTRVALEQEVARRFPELPSKMLNDALQFVEADLLDADYFLTNDRRFIAKTKAESLTSCSPSQLPFVREFM